MDILCPMLLCNYPCTATNISFSQCLLVRRFISLKKCFPLTRFHFKFVNWQMIVQILIYWTVTFHRAFFNNCRIVLVMNLYVLYCTRVMLIVLSCLTYGHTCIYKILYLFSLLWCVHMNCCNVIMNRPRSCIVIDMHGKTAHYRKTQSMYQWWPTWSIYHSIYIYPYIEV